MTCSQDARPPLPGRERAVFGAILPIGVIDGPRFHAHEPCSAGKSGSAGHVHSLAVRNGPGQPGDLLTSNLPTLRFVVRGDGRPSAAARKGGPPPLGLHLTRGAEIALKAQHMVRTIRGRLIAPIEPHARLP